MDSALKTHFPTEQSRMDPDFIAMSHTLASFRAVTTNTVARVQINWTALVDLLNMLDMVRSTA